MRLLTLSLRNFKGCREFTLETGGKDVAVYADNGVGKTTLADAETWLLFGKDSSGSADFEIKTLGADDRPIPMLEHGVEGEYLLDDGSRMILGRTLKEIWTKKRNSAEREFDGNTTDYFVNGVPVQKKEYDERVRSLCDERLFQSLTMTDHFCERLHWQKRREELLSVCGDVTDADVVASNPALAGLPEILGSRTLDEHRRTIVARKGKINEELKEIPARIDQTNRLLPAVVQMRQAPEDAADALRKLHEDRATVAAGGAVAVKTKRLRELEAEGQAIANRLSEQGRKSADEAHTLKRAKLSEADEADRKVAKIEGYIADQTDAVANYGRQRAAKLEEWNAENAKEFHHDAPDSCAACGQKLPTERVEGARTKALEEFNAAKSARLSAINDDGKALKAKIEEAQAAIDKANENLATAKEDAARLRAEAEAVQVPEVVEVDAAQDPEIQKNTEARRAIVEEIAALSASNTEELARIDAKVATLQAMIDAEAQSAALAKQREDGLRAIAELSERQKALAKEYEEIERQVWLTEEFVRTKVSLLTERINSRFTRTRFKLFRELVNGGLEECCEPMGKDAGTGAWVPYSGGLNTGARINCGLDVIDTLSGHYGFAPPIFVDHAESVTSIAPTRGQQIRLVVSKQDKSLRVEATQPQEEKVTA